MENCGKVVLKIKIRLSESFSRLCRSVSETTKTSINSSGRQTEKKKKIVASDPLEIQVLQKCERIEFETFPSENFARRVSHWLRNRKFLIPHYPAVETVPAVVVCPFNPAVRIFYFFFFFPQTSAAPRDVSSLRRVVT